MATQTPDSEYQSLIKDVKNNIRTRLGDLMSKLLNEADNILFDMAENAASNEDQNRMFELMRQLKANKAEIAVDYLENINPLLRPYEIAQKEKEKKSADLEGELSLVDKSEVDDMVLIKNIGEKASTKYREQLSHLEARLEHLALKTDDIFSKDALRPIHFCEAFDKALGDQFDINSKKLLFDIFNDEIATKLDSLYDSINNRMIDAGILPQIKLYTHQQTPKRRRSDPPPPDMPMDIPPDEGGDYPNYGNYAMTAPPGGGYGGYRGGAAGQGGVGGAGMPGAAPGGAMPGGMPGGAPGGAPGGPMPAGGAGPMGGAGGPGGGEPGMATGPVSGIPGGAMIAPAGGMSAAGGGFAGGPGGPGGPGPAAMGGAAGAAGAPATGGAAGQGMAPGAAAEGQPGAAPGTGAAGGPGGTGGGAQSGAQAGAEGEAPAGGQYSHYTAGMPANQVSQVLGNFFGVPIARADAPEGSDEAMSFAQHTASTPQFYGHDEILTALSNVQAAPTFAEPAEAGFDAEAIKGALLDEIAKKSGGMVTKRINQIAEKTIDFIELIFDAIIDDEEISDTIKALLLRLQIPVIKASMVDQEFFIYDDHPARVLLDKIADVGVGVTDHNDEVYIRLDRIVTNLVSDYDLQTSTFQEALDQLMAFVDEMEAEARKIEEEAQRQVLRDHARNIVLKSLRGVTAGKVLPEAVHPLVLKRWPTLMFNHYLEFGKENDEWVNIIDILREIISSVQPIESAEELAHIEATQGNLVAEVRHLLSRTNQSPSDIENVIQGLVDTHQSHIEGCDFSEEQMVEAEETIAEEDWQPPAMEQPAEEEEVEEAPKPQLPSSIMPGMWFRVNMGEDSVARRCKLSVIIVEDSRLVFVNHAGEIVVEKGFEEFTEEIENGLSSIIMGHSVFDHALNSVITKLAPEEA